MRTVKLTTKRLRQIIKEEFSEFSNFDAEVDYFVEPSGTTGTIDVDDDFFKNFPKEDRSEVTAIDFGDEDIPTAIVTWRSGEVEEFTYDLEQGWSF